MKTVAAERGACQLEALVARPGGGQVALVTTVIGEELILVTDAKGKVVRSTPFEAQDAAVGGRPALSVEPGGGWAIDAGPRVLYRVYFSDGRVEPAWVFEQRGEDPTEAVVVAHQQVVAICGHVLSLLTWREDGALLRLDSWVLPSVFWHAQASPDGQTLVLTAWGHDRQTDPPQIRVYGVAPGELRLAASIPGSAKQPTFDGGRCFATRGRAGVEVVGATAVARGVLEAPAVGTHRDRVLRALAAAGAAPAKLTPVPESKTFPELSPAARQTLVDDPWTYWVDLGAAGVAMTSAVIPGADVVVHAKAAKVRAVKGIERPDDSSHPRPVWAARDGRSFIIGDRNSEGVWRVDTRTLRAEPQPEVRETYGAADVDDERMVCLDLQDVLVIERESLEALGAEVRLEHPWEMVYDTDSGVALVRDLLGVCRLYAIQDNEVLPRGELPGPILGLRQHQGGIFVNYRSVWCVVSGLATN